MPPCLTLSIIRYGSRVKWNNPEKGVAPSPKPWCSSYRKGSLRVILDYGRQLYFYMYENGFGIRLPTMVDMLLNQTRPNKSIPSFFPKPLGTLQNVSTTIVITAIVLFRCSFCCLARSKYLSIFSLSFIHILWSAAIPKSAKWQVLFSHQLTLMVFHRILSDSKSPQVFRTFLSILADLNNAVVWMVLIHPPISNFSSLLFNPL